MRFLFLFLVPFLVSAAPRKADSTPQASVLRELQSHIEALQMEYENYETQLGMFDERVNNQEDTLISLREQILNANQAQKDLHTNLSAKIETKIAALEKSTKALIEDMQQLKNHANETSELFNQLKTQLVELEKTLSKHTQNLDGLQSAMLSITEAFQTKEGLKTYKIKSGDSLEKIARANNTSVKMLKELNNLSDDKIVIGQTLQLP